MHQLKDKVNSIDLVDIFDQKSVCIRYSDKLLRRPYTFVPGIEAFGALELEVLILLTYLFAHR